MPQSVGLCHPHFSAIAGFGRRYLPGTTSHHDEHQPAGAGTDREFAAGPHPAVQSPNQPEDPFGQTALL